MPVYSIEKADLVQGYLNSSYGVNRCSRETRDGEFNFFLANAEKANGSILELACGAGRVLMELAKRGFTVFGIEASPHMLRIGIDAVRELSLQVQRRIHFIQGDMRQFAFKKKFPLIIIPFNSF